MSRIVWIARLEETDGMTELLPPNSAVVGAGRRTVGNFLQGATRGRWNDVQRGL